MVRLVGRRLTTLPRQDLLSGGERLAGPGYLGYDAAGVVVSIANFAAGQAGARVTGGDEDSRPVQALAQVAELPAQNKLVIKVQTFPFDRAAEAYRISQDGQVRGSSSWSPSLSGWPTVLR